MESTQGPNRRYWWFLGIAAGLVAIACPLFAGPAQARDLPMPGAVLASAKKPPQIRGIRVRKAGANAVKLRVRVTYPSDLSDGTTADVTVSVWRKPNHRRKVGMVHKQFPLSGGRSDSFTSTHRLRITGKPGKRLKQALRRKGSAARLATVSVTQSRLPGSDGKAQSVVSSSKQVGGNGAGQRLSAGRQYGFSIYNTSSRPVKLSALPVDCVFNDGAANSSVSAITGTRLAPGQTYTAYVAANRGGEKAKDTSLPISRFRSLSFELRTLQAAAANDTLWGDPSGRNLTYGAQVSALPKQGGCKKAGNGDFAIAAETADGEHDEAYLTVRPKDRLTGSTLPGGHGVQISSPRTDGGQVAVTVADPASNPTECTSDPSDRPWMWMTCMDQTGPSGWKNMPVSRMALTATHDAQTAGLSEDRLWVPKNVATDSDAKCGHYNPAFLPDRDAVVSEATTQTQDLREQLDRGARVLDVRFAYPATDFKFPPHQIDDWYGTHAAQVPWTMDNQLDQIVKWAHDHPKELVIVKLSLCNSEFSKGDVVADAADAELGIGGNGNTFGLCAVSGNYPAEPGDIRRKDVQAGHNVALYWSEVNADADLGADSAFGESARRKCGWHYDHDQVGAEWAGNAVGSELCAPADKATVILYPFAPKTQAELVKKANEGIDKLRQAFKNKQAWWQYLYEISTDAGMGGMQLIWTVAVHPEFAAYRFIRHLCPANNIADNNLLRGMGYQDNSGIDNRYELFYEFLRYAGVFMVDDIDKEFAAKVISLNNQRAQASITYTGLRGWAVNGGRNACMDLSGGSTDAGTLLQMFNCVGDTPNQRFTLTDTGELHVQTADSQCLEARLGAPNPNDRVVRLEPCNNRDEQHWTLDADGRISGIGGACMKAVGFNSIPMRPCDASDLEDWTLIGTLKSTATKNCLALPSVNAGTRLVLQPCQANDQQVFARLSTSQLKIKDNCVQGGPAGTPVTLAPCASPGADGADTQIWEASQGQWKLPSQNACLGADGSGAQAQMVACSSQNTWRLEGY